MFNEYMIPGGLTPREYYRIHGRLEQSHIDCLLDAHEDSLVDTDVSPYLEEARGMYPSEDFLGSAIKLMKALAKNVRGVNVVDANLIVEALEELQSEQYSRTEHGIDELRKALKELKEAES